MASSNPGASGRAYGGVSAADRVAQRRERLLDAALELYGTRGYGATGVKDICRQAGLTDRYYYESFRDAPELFIAVFDRATEALLQLVAERVADAPAEPERQVRAAIDGFVRELARDPRTARVIFVEASSAGAEVEHHMRARLRQFAQLVAATARPHIAADVPDRMVQLGALSLVGAIERVLIEWQDGELDATIDELVEFLVQFFLAAGTLGGVNREI
jgi:AcrR family transcriptional regulator